MCFKCFKPGSHQQQCRSNIRLCSIRQCCFDIVAGVDRVLGFNYLMFAWRRWAPVRGALPSLHDDDDNDDKSYKLCKVTYVRNSVNPLKLFSVLNFERCPCSIRFTACFKPSTQSSKPIRIYCWPWGCIYSYPLLQNLAGPSSLSIDLTLNNHRTNEWKEYCRRWRFDLFPASMPCRYVQCGPKIVTISIFQIIR